MGDEARNIVERQAIKMEQIVRKTDKKKKAAEKSQVKPVDKE